MGRIITFPPDIINNLAREARYPPPSEEHAERHTRFGPDGPLSDAARAVRFGWTQAVSERPRWRFDIGPPEKGR